MSTKICVFWLDSTVYLCFWLISGHGLIQCIEWLVCEWYSMCLSLANVNTL